MWWQLKFPKSAKEVAKFMGTSGWQRVTEQWVQEHFVPYTGTSSLDFEWTWATKGGVLHMYQREARPTTDGQRITRWDLSAPLSRIREISTIRKLDDQVDRFMVKMLTIGSVLRMDEYVEIQYGNFTKRERSYRKYEGYDIPLACERGESEAFAEILATMARRMGSRPKVVLDVPGAPSPRGLTPNATDVVPMPKDDGAVDEYLSSNKDWLHNSLQYMLDHFVGDYNDFPAVANYKMAYKYTGTSAGGLLTVTVSNVESDDSDRLKGSVTSTVPMDKVASIVVRRVLDKTGNEAHQLAIITSGKLVNRKELVYLAGKIQKGRTSDAKVGSYSAVLTGDMRVVNALAKIYARMAEQAGSRPVVEYCETCARCKGTGTRLNELGKPVPGAVCSVCIGYGAGPRCSTCDGLGHIGVLGPQCTKCQSAGIVLSAEEAKRRQGGERR